MKMGLLIYRMATLAAAPILVVWLARRARNGQETRTRLNERYARTLPPRPAGDLVWLHGASIGESKLLLAIANALHQRRPDLNFLMTSQTSSAAKIVADNLPPNSLHQMAPIDTPAVSRRFISHWQPNLYVLAESEIWPNLLDAAHSGGTATALINARMTKTSLGRWRKFSRSASRIFSAMSLINATDKATASLLSDVTGRTIQATANLKIGASISHSCETLQNAPIECGLDTGYDTKILLGASTHESEEELLINAFKTLPEGTNLILAPRHTKRAAQISELLTQYGLSHTLRSKNGKLTPEYPVLIADTFGEMDTWYACADLVYLGGGHAPGIGGHNPLEPLRFEKPVLSGPHISNFQHVYDTLQELQLVKIVTSSSDISAAFNNSNRPDCGVLDTFMQSGKQQFDATADALTALITRAPE